MPNIRNRATCHDCDRAEDEDNGLIGTAYASRICQNCYESNYFTCDNCHEVFNDSDERDSGMCANCYSEECEIPYRGYSTSEEHFENVREGRIIRSLRPFGVELEVTYEDEDKEEAVKMVRALPRSVGVTSDGSVNNIGIEIQTPKSAGYKAEDIIQATCKSFADNGASVDSSCGYHVHIDVDDLQRMSAGEQFNCIRNLWLFYIAFEDVLMSFLPESRRHNSFCHPLRSDYHFKEILDTHNIDKLEQIWYRVTSIRNAQIAKNEHKHESRYRGINLHSLFSDRHLEIRFHSGTLNMRKILEWANLHLMIVDRVFNNGIDRSFMGEMMNSVSLEEKTKAFFQYLNLPKSSIGYFLTRQEKFKIISPKIIVSKSDVDATEAILASEAEN